MLAGFWPGSLPVPGWAFLPLRDSRRRLLLWAAVHVLVVVSGPKHTCVFCGIILKCFKNIVPFNVKIWGSLRSRFRVINTDAMGEI